MLFKKERCSYADSKKTMMICIFCVLNEMLDLKNVFYKDLESQYADIVYALIEEGKEKGITYRVLGGAAVRLHCPNFRYLHNAMNRILADLDFISYNKYTDKSSQFFIERHCMPDKRFIATHNKRHKYSCNDLTIEVYFDELNFCHKIDLKERLELDYPTITLADLFLGKMQIIQLTEKDIVDTIVLLLEHELGNSDKETINMDYIAKLLSDDWGFSYTVTTNLKKVTDLMNEKIDVLEKKHKENIESKINAIIKRLDEESKTFKWKMRAKIGTRKAWYTEVE